MTILLISSGYNEFTGYTQSMIKYSNVTNRWEIWNEFDKMLIATLNYTSNLPYGVHSWYFTDSLFCTNDHGDHTRYLNLHPEVEEPGSFCCNDGHCISSELVCDSQDQEVDVPWPSCHCCFHPRQDQTRLCKAT